MHRVGVRGRLLLAFLGISAFAVIAAASGFYSFGQIDRALQRITQDRVPAAVASLELSRQAERVVAAAPALLSVADAQKQREVAAGVAVEIAAMTRRFDDLKGGLIDGATLSKVEPLIAGLSENLAALNDLVAARLANRALRDRQLRDLSRENNTAQGVVALGLSRIIEKVEEAQRPGADTNAQTLTGFADDLAPAVQQQRAQAEFTAVYNALAAAALAESTYDLDVLRVHLDFSFNSLDDLAKHLDAQLRSRLVERIAAFRGFYDGPGSILDTRAREIRLTTAGEALLRKNAELSGDLTLAVAAVVERAQTDIASAKVNAHTVQVVSTGILLAVVVLSLISSALIVWLYVGRNLIARLTALSNSMLAIAGGNLRAAVPVPGSDELGEMARALTIFRETAVEVEDKRLRELYALLETIDYGVLILDPDLRVRIHNRAYRELSGMTAEFLTARPHFRELVEHFRRRRVYDVPDEAWEEFVEQRVQEVVAEEPSSSELRLQSGRVIQFRCEPFPWGGRMLTYYDLTTIKQNEAALVAAKREADSANLHKSKFLANMSHELRTPLNGILGFTENILEGIYGVVPERARGALDRIQHNGHHLLNLINEVLDLSKIEAGQIELFIEEYSLAAVVESAIAATESIARNKGLEVRKDIAADLPRGRGDARRVYQVLVNLVGNAIKFTDAGFVDVTVREHGGTFVLAVRDSGPGIAAADHVRIFEEFQQVGNVTTRKAGGTGLGLPISKRLIELHGGSIRVESALGAGATFHVVLPVRADLAKAAE